MDGQHQETIDDPPKVRYVSSLFLRAMDLGMLEFSLRRTESWFTISGKGGSEDLSEFARTWLVRCPSCGRHLDSLADQLDAVSADDLWSRILTMAEMDEGSAEGTIRIEVRTRYPHMDWTIKVRRPEPDLLDFRLKIDRVHMASPE